MYFMAGDVSGDSEFSTEKEHIPTNQAHTALNMAMAVDASVENSIASPPAINQLKVKNPNINHCSLYIKPKPFR
jgi:hypothetical protein